jgi:hypothetical protein
MMMPQKEIMASEVQNTP